MSRAARLALLLLLSYDVPNAVWAQAAPAARDETADWVAIERLVTEHAYLLDHGRADELAALFTADAVFDNLSIGLHAVGRAAIADYYARRAKELRFTRHVSTNLRVVFTSPGHASGTRTILYYRADGGTPPFPAKPASVGEYTETFVREKDGRWRIAMRKNQLLFTSDERASGNE